MSAVRAEPCELRECSGCGRFQIVRPMSQGMMAVCERCPTTLRRAYVNSHEISIALNLAALVLLVILCATTLMSVETAGIELHAGLFSGPSELSRQGMASVAIVVVFVTVIAPFGKLAGTLYVLIRMQQTQPPRHLRRVFAWAERLAPWSMLEVFVFGVFVAYVKLGDLVKITLENGVYALMVLTFVLAWADGALYRASVWARLGGPQENEPEPESVLISRGAVGCETCGLVSVPVHRHDSGHATCPRCDSPLHVRKPNSVARTWALLIAASVMYVPANYFPVLTIMQLGAGSPSTILGGVEELVSSRMYPLAALVFFASVAVPMLKLVGLSTLLIATQSGNGRWLARRTRLYQIICWIGRWSMIDIFMEALLGALVRFGNVVTIEPGFGAVAFCSVVILTIFAAESFDPRLMWDAASVKRSPVTPRQVEPPSRRGFQTMSRVTRILPVLAVFLIIAGTALADGPWSGYWATTWRDGGARLQLDQQGGRVSGTYQHYGGRVEAIAKGRRLEGRWSEGDASGAFAFVMDRAGDSFSGRYDTGEWWTGARSTAPNAPATFDHSSPREVFRHFIIDCNVARSGRPDDWGNAMLSVDLGDASKTMPRGEKLQRVQDLFGVIDLTTFRIWSVPDDAPGETLMVRLEQSGTDASLTLTMVRDATGSWRIRVPGVHELEVDRHALLTARGGQPPTADAFARLQSPRNSMRSFLEGMANWEGAGGAMALSTLDLSGIPEVLRDGQGGLIAQYLRRVLDQVGLIGLQAIPNDGTDRTPYLHFSHPAGQIVIAPIGTEAGAPWKFTAATVADIDDLYRAMEGLPPPLATPPGSIPNAPFFTLRDIVRAKAPGLLDRVGPVEYLASDGRVLRIDGSALIGVLAAWPIRRVTAWLSGDGSGQPRLFTWALAITFALMFASNFPTMLGVPEQIRRITYPIIGIILISAASVAVWHLLGAIGLALQRLSARTVSATDDILFNLLLAGSRLGVVITAFLAIAHFLSIPTNGILAGLGVGGLAFAFASRETLSNVFGAGILVADRPFRRGDWITAGDIDGSVAHVGIRSTRVRSAQDSIVVVPNGRLANSTINNLGTRRHRLFKTQFLVTACGTPERLDQFAAAVRQRVTGDESFVASRTDVGVSGIGETGIQVELTTYIDVATSSAERAAKHALLVDVVRLAKICGLTLGLGMLSAEQPASVTEKSLA